MITIGPDFQPPPAFGPFQIAMLGLVLDVLQRVDRDLPGIYTLTSWHRTPERNAQVGGRADSLHLQGLAMDYVVDRRALFPLLDFITNDAAARAGRDRVATKFRALAAPFTQAVIEPNGSGHLELDLTT